MAPRRPIHDLADTLRKNFPTAFPVSVRVARIENGYGDADLIGEDDARRFVISIDSRLEYGLQVHFLVHEWAHCIRWDYRHDYGDADWHAHDGAWGVHHAEIYSFVFHGD